MTKSVTCDFLIIGAGIIGLCLARALHTAFPKAKIIIIEKEASCGWHASGRNSGVLHAGFYYTADSLKAKLTRVGNQLLTEYCHQKKIPIHACGKLVVARNESDLPLLDILLKRAQLNSVILHNLTEHEAREIEPRVNTFQRALFSPTTGAVNPKQVMAALQEETISNDIYIHYQVKYLSRRRNNLICTTAGTYETGYVVNTAGLYADKIAKDFQFSSNYHILPFRGFYLYSNEPAHALKTHIYPVPDLQYPFLGVHFTVTAEGRIKIGPTAVPAFWREQYHLYERFNLRECLDILYRQASLFLHSQFDFKKLAIAEMKKCSKQQLIKQAAYLVKGVSGKTFAHFGPTGIRAQLINMKERKIEMDFVLERDKQSMHVLNAVSPAFTCAFSFSQYVCDQIQAYL